LRSAARPGPGPAGVRGLGCGDRDDPRRRPRRRGRRGPGAEGAPQAKASRQARDPPSGWPWRGWPTPPGRSAGPQAGGLLPDVEWTVPLWTSRTARTGAWFTSRPGSAPCAS